MKNIDKAIKIISIFEIIVIFILLIAIFGPKIFNKSDNKIVNKNIISNTIEINLPKEMIDLFGENFEYTLTQEQKDNGFTSIKKNDDGSAIYTIKKKDYEVFLETYREKTKQVIDEISKNEAFISIKSITYNEDFSKIVISAKKDEFENSFDSMSMMTCGLSSCMYQMFDINASGKCLIEVKDFQTGEVFKTAEYPEEIQNKN